VNELFAGWKDHPPTNILVKALLDGFAGGGKKSSADGGEINIPPSAQDAMQRAAVAAISAKADAKWLPVTRGRDPGMPTSAPVFDVDELRSRNREVIKKRAKRGPSGV